MFLDANPSIRHTIFILSETLQYVFDVNQTITIHTLKKLLSSAARLRKNSFRVFSNNTEYTHLNDLDIQTLFPTQQTITFTIHQIELPTSSSVIKVKLNNYCNEHELKYLNYYCFNCNKSICSQCASTPFHRDHHLKEKYDYFQSSSYLIASAFKQHYTLSQPFVVSNSKYEIKRVSFQNIYEVLNGIEHKLNEVIDMYNSITKMSVDAVERNRKDIKQHCIKGLELLKEKIEIRNILIYDEVFLLFHNKYNNLARQQGMKLDEQIKMVSELENVVGKDVNEFVKKVCDDIYDMLNRVLNVDEYDELKKRIKKKMVRNVNEKEIINDIIEVDDDKNNSNVYVKKRRPYSTMNDGSVDKDEYNNKTSRRKSDMIYNIHNKEEYINSDNDTYYNQYTHSKLINKAPNKHNITTNSNNNIKRRKHFHIRKSSLLSPPPTTSQPSPFTLTNNNIQIQTNSYYIHSHNHNNNNNSNTQSLLPFIVSPIPNTNKLKAFYLNKTTSTLQVSFPSLYGTSIFYPNTSHCNYNSSLYISGGIESTTPLTQSSSLFKYDSLSNTLFKLHNMHIPRHNHTMKAHNNIIYAIGGYNTNTCERYIIPTNKWELMPNMNHKREKALIVVHAQHLYCFCGKTCEAHYNTIERIALNSNNSNARWEDIIINCNPNLCMNMYGCGLYEIGNDLLLCGGNVNGDNVNRICLFDFKEMKMEEDVTCYMKYKVTFTENEMYLFEDKLVQISDDYIPVVIQLSILEDDDSV